jgi:hypothetical protein
VLGFDGGQTEPPSILFRHFHISAGIVDHTGHGRLVTLSGAGIIIIVPGKASHGRPPAGASASTLAVSSQRVATCKLPVALWADMRLFSRMQFAVTFEIMETPESHLAILTDVGLFLAMRKKMALQIVMSRELGIAVGALVFL